MASFKGKNNGNYKHGKTLKIIYCLDCTKKLSKNAFYYGYKRCRNCSSKNNWKINPIYKLKSGKHIRTIEIKAKFRKTVALNGGRSGTKNSNWKHGLSSYEYPAEFNKSLKNKIKCRDNNRCMNCYISRQRHFKNYNIDLCVHHIDYNKFNCKENNLITTCLKCNIKANSNRDYWFAYYTYIMG